MIEKKETRLPHFQNPREPLGDKAVALEFDTRKRLASAKMSPAPMPDDTLRLDDLRRYVRSWLFDCEYKPLSSRTLDSYRFTWHKFLWFLESQGHETCGPDEIREFLAYLSTAHTKGGRWAATDAAGEPLPGRSYACSRRGEKALEPITTKTYYSHLRAFFRWAEKQDKLKVNPCRKIDTPRASEDQLQPFADDQFAKLLEAAKKSKFPRRDTAILWLLLATGLRSSELCGLKIKDVDLDQRRCRVLGKGNKERMAYWGRACQQALVNYLQEVGYRDEDEPLFAAEWGPNKGGPLTRQGVGRIFKQLNKDAQLKSVRVSPHTMRHTSAVVYLREKPDGTKGDPLSCKERLGHTTLKMTMRYVQYADADLARKAKLFSPDDTIKSTLKKHP